MLGVEEFGSSRPIPGIHLERMRKPQKTSGTLVSLEEMKN
jgi:hypothetical protein